MPEFAKASSSGSSVVPGLPNTYCTPSARRISANTSAPRRSPAPLLSDDMKAPLELALRLYGTGMGPCHHLVRYLQTRTMRHLRCRDAAGAGQKAAGNLRRRRRIELAQHIAGERDVHLA